MHKTNAAWSENEIKFLIDNYPAQGKAWCCKEMGKSEASVRYTASKLGLRMDKTGPNFLDFQRRAAKSKVGKKRPEHSEAMKIKAANGDFPVLTTPRTPEQKAETSRRNKRWIAEHGHPKGFLNGTHSDASRRKMSEASKSMWGKEGGLVNSQEHRQILSDRAVAGHKRGLLGGGYSRGRMGTYNINGREIYFRSLWEANYALYLDFLAAQKQIKAWQFESKTFWFEAIRRGVRSYKPDFEVENLDGTIEFHEVKGWMDAKSKTKLKRMAKYHPDVKMIVVAGKQYKEITQKLSGVIKFYV